MKKTRASSHVAVHSTVQKKEEKSLTRMIFEKKKFMVNHINLKILNRKTTAKMFIKKNHLKKFKIVTINQNME